MLKRLAKTAIKKRFIAYFRGLAFKKALEFLNFFYYAIFGSVILKLLFLKMGF
ncbi:hypothetical protein HPSNT_04070 [Helicobacter pylori SNT49]|uniref:Uncharacterized protein n=1 Tax=Helicobacter pylori SNT49 TaxID=1055530 RepID=G2MC09_HELPX|nr:hypothetical protein [Helicobacter pylori]AEN16964.1 hypothetical protein HPSNT_04070 [Helicobacter pylori SNT49]